MADWPEITNVKKTKKCELVLSGKSVSERLEKSGLCGDLFSCTNLNFLQISETSLQHVPAKIKTLHNLTSLVLHSNNLTELCPEIGELTKLKLLNVSNNKIREIPSTISKLEVLSTLNMSSNKIEKIPDMSLNKWLATLDLSHNEIDDMSELCHDQLIHLAELHLKGNKINKLPAAVGKLVALKVLDVCGNQIAQIPGELGDAPKLKDVNFQGNPLADKRLGKLVIQGKPKPILDYIREHCPRENGNDSQAKGKKGKSKGSAKSISSGGESMDSVSTVKFKIIVKRSEQPVIIKRTKFALEIRPHIMACIIKNFSCDTDTMKKFIQLQNKLHDGLCEKRNVATIATHDLALCEGRQFSFTALSPETLKIVPLSRNKEFSGKELFDQLHSEAEAFRKEKKRSTYSGIYKFLHLLEDQPLYPCLLNTKNTIISFPPLTNSEVTKLSLQTKEVMIEVTSSTAQSKCKKVLDTLLREMVLNGIGTTNEEDCTCLTVEQARVEEPDGALISVYPSQIDLVFEDNTVTVERK